MASSILITGASAGIGKACALELAKPGVHLTLACRSREKTEPVLAELRARGATAAFLGLDLGDLQRASEAGRSFAAQHASLDVLIANAGVAGVRGITKDGYELAFGTNHLGHFAFARPLLPLLSRAQGRLVVVSSGKHFGARRIPFEALRKPTRTVVGMQEYGVSKLCNVLFAAEVRRRYPAITAVAVNPGRIATDIVRRVPWPMRAWIPTLFRLDSAAVGGATLVSAMQAPKDARDGSVPLYFDKLAVKEASALTHDTALSAALWRFSEDALLRAGV